MQGLILRKKTVSIGNDRKQIFIDTDLHKQIKQLKDETGVSMTEIVDAFLRYGIDNVVIKEEDE